jgi:hypothetical protein
MGNHVRRGKDSTVLAKLELKPNERFVLGSRHGPLSGR